MSEADHMARTVKELSDVLLCELRGALDSNCDESGACGTLFSVCVIEQATRFAANVEHRKEKQS